MGNHFDSAQYELGFIGLGAMGGRMVKRLLDAGYTVTGYNRTKAKAKWLLDAGMRWGDTPRAVAEATDVTFSMVTNTAAVRAITGEPDGLLAGLAPGKIYVDMSTISPAASRELAAQVAAKGARMLDAPVSGSVSTLEEGRLSIMVGGDRETFNKVEPIGGDDSLEALTVKPHLAGRARTRLPFADLGLPVHDKRE